ncbi:hypothetical protein I4U23_009351 [Adineta vaga]|nr:hypothetical protein I4U23_009351 [Adineta vaga]
MSHAPIKKSVFDRIGGNSSSPSGAANTNNKSTHGFCNAFIKTGTCPLGDTCKFIHEQPNFDKQPGLNEEFRITKTITRVIDMSSSPIKSTVTVSNEQRPVVISSCIQSNRTVVESVTTSTDQPDRRLSSSSNDRKQSESRYSNLKTKSSSNSIESSKKKSHSSSRENRQSSNKKQRTTESDSSISSTSDSEYAHSSCKYKKKSNHSSSSKRKKPEPISPLNHEEEETLNDQLLRQTQSYNRSPKRTIVITKTKEDENTKQTNKDSKNKSVPEIEFLGSKKIKPEKKSVETIHQQAENNKKSKDVKREKKSPSKSISDQQRRHSSSTNTSSTSINERNLQIKAEDANYRSNKTQNSSEQYERSNQNVSESTPSIVRLSHTPPIQGTSEISEKGSIELPLDTEKSHTIQPSSPICVILDDDSSPAPSIDKKDVRQTSTTPIKKSNETEKTSSSKSSKRTRDGDKSQNKDKTSDSVESKRKRLSDGSSKKVISNSKTRNESRSTNSRSDAHRSVNTSSRDESSSRKHKEKSELKPSRSNDSKDHNSTKSRSNHTRPDTTRSPSEKKRSIHHRGKEKDLENVTDSEEHFDELAVPKQTAIEAYIAMDWSLLSRDKRIPLNSQVTSRIARINNNDNLFCVSDRLLTNEQKEKLQGLDFQSLPLTHYMKQLQSKSKSQIVNSCYQRFGSCAKDMIEMRHKWFTSSIEPVQRYEFINKEHFLAYQQAINSLLDKTSIDPSTVQIETATTTAADIMLS